VESRVAAAAKADASDDLIAGASDWLYLTLRRLGRPKNAATALEYVIAFLRVRPVASGRR